MFGERSLNVSLNYILWWLHGSENPKYFMCSDCSLPICCHMKSKMTLFYRVLNLSNKILPFYTVNTNNYVTSSILIISLV